MTPAAAVAMTKRRRWYPIMPQHSVTAVRPPGMNRHMTMSGIPNRSSERCAQARRRAPFSPRKNLRPTRGPNRWPSR
jgi:hypothetical protein